MLVGQDLLISQWLKMHVKNCTNVMFTRDFSVRSEGKQQGKPSLQY